LACVIFKENTQRSGGSWLWADFPRKGQRELVVNKTINRVDFLLCRYGSPVGTLYARIRRTFDDSVMQTSATTLDVSTVTACDSYTWYAFLFNQFVNEEVRFLVEYSGGNNTNYIRVGYVNIDVIAGNFCTYTQSTGLYGEYMDWDCSIKVWETEEQPTPEPGARWPLYKYFTLTV